MLVVNTWSGLLLAGMLGPVLVEVAKIASASDPETLRQRLMSPMYWIVAAALILLGGAIAVLNGLDPGGVPFLRAAELGATGPAVIGAWATARPNIAGARAVPGLATKRKTQPSLLDLLRW